MEDWNWNRISLASPNIRNITFRNSKLVQEWKWMWSTTVSCALHWGCMLRIHSQLSTWPWGSKTSNSRCGLDGQSQSFWKKGLDQFHIHIRIGILAALVPAGNRCQVQAKCNYGTLLLSWRPSLMIWASWIICFATYLKKAVDRAGIGKHEMSTDHIGEL